MSFLIIENIFYILENNFKNCELIFDKNLLSKIIMYKTYFNEKNLQTALKVIRLLITNKNKLIELSVKNEYLILYELCEHECIREEIKTKLKQLFN